MSSNRNSGETSGGFEGAVYHDRDSAEDTVARLQRLGYGQNDISVMARDQDRAREFAEATGTKAYEGTVAGGVIGGALGAIIAGLTATGSIGVIAASGGAAAPLVAGPLAAALAGLGTGAVAGGILGALIGAGIPEERAKEYQRGIDQGGMLIGVHPRDEHRDDVRRIFAPDTETTSRGDIPAGGSQTLASDEVVPRRNVH